ncbi:MAG: LemA family protein [Nitrospirota bacterium]
MSKGLIAVLAVLGAVILAVLIIGGGIISTRNRLVTMDEAINGQWSQVENQLQRRNDLIPNLVNTVKGYAAHEKEIFENIAAARAKMAGATTRQDKIDGSNQMTSALSRLMMVVENYPNLKADQNFSQLMDELAGTENRLAVERMRYNNLVRDYNASLRRFPDNMIASMFNFKPAAYFKVPKEAQAVPKVQF